MAQKKTTSVLRKQAVMRRVLLACVPCVIGSIYFFGWRSLVSVLVCCFFGFLAEFVFCRKRGEPVTEAVFVTSVLFALVMPPDAAWHVQIVGVVFAVVFSKQVFGGFGKNFFNPALAGRCFVYICFPVAMTGIWPGSADLGGIGALAQWSSAGNVEAITSATPMAIAKAGGEIPELSDLFLGGLSGTMGVTSALLILIGGGYLFYTKTANRTTIISIVSAYAIINQVLIFCGAINIDSSLAAVLGGGFLFGVFFMATDPISSPRTHWGRIYYGIIIAVSTTVIRNFSIFNGGLMFSILLGNMFAPIIDHGVNSFAAWRKSIATAKEGA